MVMYPRPQSIWTVLDGRQQLVKNMVIVSQNRLEQPIIGILALLSKTAKVFVEVPGPNALSYYPLTTTLTALIQESKPCGGGI